MQSGKRIILVSVILFALTIQLGKAQDSAWNYTYQEIDMGKGVFYTLDPHHPVPVETMLPSPVHDEYFHPDDYLISPNHQLLLLLYRERFGYLHIEFNSGQVEIVDMATRQAHTVTLSDAPIWLVKWSPDSRYIAFSTLSPYSHFEDIYLYEVATGWRQNLTNDTDTHYDLAWSPTSDRLVIYSGSISNGENPYYCLKCEPRLGIYTLAEQRYNAVADLTRLGNLVARERLFVVCDLSWSPDGNFIAFLTGCPGGYHPFHKEVYVLNVATSSLKSVTPYTGNENTPIASMFSADYVMAWSDAAKLLVSMKVEQFYAPADAPLYPTPRPPIIQSVIYDAAADSTSILFKDTFIEEWAVHISTGAIAFSLDDNNGSVQVGTIGPQGFKVIASGPYGRDLDWSPDGNFLAYEVLPTTDRYGVSTGFAFVDNTDGKITKYDSGILPIGWLEG